MEEVKTAEQILTDIKEIAAKKNGYVSYRNALDVSNSFGVDPLVNKVAQLFASQQTALLREENARLKEVEDCNQRTILNLRQEIAELKGEIQPLQQFDER